MEMSLTKEKDEGSRKKYGNVLLEKLVRMIKVRIVGPFLLCTMRW
jgi:hypothetical protein